MSVSVGNTCILGRVQIRTSVAMVPCLPLTLECHLAQAQKFGPLPPPTQIIKLSGQTRGNGGFISWRGRQRGGAERALDGTWVRSNFKATYLDKVAQISAGGSAQVERR